MKLKEAGAGQDSARVAVSLDGAIERIGWNMSWRCEKWSEEAVDFARAKLEAEGTTHIQDGVRVVRTGEMTWDNVLQRPTEKLLVTPRMIPIQHGITSRELQRLVGDAEVVQEIAGNLLLNEGIDRLLDLLIAAGGTSYNNANAYIGVGDTNTAAAASQTELQATQNAANRFYKAMVATWPQRTAETVDWKADFTSTEANFAWAEWTIAAGATTASGSGFLVGTTNLNRKVQSLGTKVTGTWTMTGSVTVS